MGKGKGNWRISYFYIPTSHRIPSFPLGWCSYGERSTGAIPHPCPLYFPEALIGISCGGIGVRGLHVVGDRADAIRKALLGGRWEKKERKVDGEVSVK